MQNNHKVTQQQQRQNNCKDMQNDCIRHNTIIDSKATESQNKCKDTQYDSEKQQRRNDCNNKKNTATIHSKYDQKGTQNDVRTNAKDNMIVKVTKCLTSGQVTK